jgi:trehalose 6-phosphate phosphatase
VRQILTTTLGSIKGVFVEDKGLTLSVHYRQADETRTQTVQQIADQSLKGPLLTGILKITQGKKVVEVRPAVSRDKGRAIRLLMKRHGKGGKQSGLIPIYLRDDLTDEDGFKMIARYGQGISIYVGDEPEKSIAAYFLKSTEEVPVLIDKLLESESRNTICEQLSTI